MFMDRWVSLPSSLMSNLMHRYMWATPLVAGPRLSPWEVHPEGVTVQSLTDYICMRDRVICVISGSGIWRYLSLPRNPSRRRKNANPNQAWRGMGSARLYLSMIRHMKWQRFHNLDRSSPGSTRTAPSAAHHDGGEKYATGVTTSKVLASNNIIIGTWNLRTLRIAGKLEE